VGTLSSTNYSFGPFVPGTLTVTYTRPCLTGNVGKLTVGAGQAICLGSGANLSGGVKIDAGGSLDIEGATLSGGVDSKGGGVLRICGSTIGGGLKIAGSTGLVLVGGDAATGPCAGNLITGGAKITDGSGGVEFNGNTGSGGLTITGNTGTLPPPDTGPVHVSGNSMSGKINIQS